MKKILITTGDVDGIGLEVSLKALAKIKPIKNIQFYFFSNPKSEKKYYSLLDKQFKRIVFTDLHKALGAPLNSKYIYEIKIDLNPALCFEQAVLAAINKRIDAIVTAPLSKKLIQSSGLNDKGHTDIMRRLVKTDKPVLMAFKGSLFSLVLASDHIPLIDVPSSLNFENLKTMLLSSHEYLKTLKLPKNISKIGLLGLNPHAGEIEGLGTEERNILIPLIDWAKSQKIPISGPLIPDVCFQDPEYKKFGLYIALYHDQGLIPFKIYHKKNHGIQISLNLPFIRVSVDHGTASNIFGKNIADPTSMKTAILTAIDLL